MAMRAPRVAELLSARTGALLVAVGLTYGCSLVFDENPRQCATTADCLVRGSAFADSVCQAGTCVSSSALREAGGPDATTTTIEASVEATLGADVGADVTAEVAAEAGAQCTTFADCPIPTGSHSEVTCSPDTQRCVQLTSDECPLVIGDYQYSKNIAPVILGAFALLPSANPMSDASYLNYALAIDEFSSGQAVSGIPAGPGSKLRTPVVVVCSDVSAQVDTAMKHLAFDVHVPAVVAALNSADLRVAFSNYGYNTSANLFMVNPFGADSTLTALQRGQQFWHMLGTPNDTAGAYQPLLARVEAYLRNTVPWRADLAGGPLRVATVTANATVLTDQSAATLPTLQWNNGNGQAASGNAFFDSEMLSDSTLNGTALKNIDVSQVVSDLLAFKPHVVISFGCDEFVTALQTLDLEWASTNPANPPPFYIVGPYNSESTALLNWVGEDEARRERVVGINFASTTATAVLEQYDARFVLAGNDKSLLGSENYYDAMYFTVDSLVGGADVTAEALSGPDVGGGMLRLISPAGTPYNMGPDDMGHVLLNLTSSNASTISLQGALGPPVFNTATGARVSQGDVYCINVHSASDAGPASTAFGFDALRLTPSADGGAATLTGTPCFTGL